MDRKLLKIAVGWGFLLWLFGYVLGILLFAVLPTNILGWVIMPFGIAVTLWVLFKKISLKRFNEYVLVGIIWTVIAILFDYFFLVKLFKPADGYYKLDVYTYYLLTFLLPIMVGWKKTYER